MFRAGSKLHYGYHWLCQIRGKFQISYCLRCLHTITLKILVRNLDPKCTRKPQILSAITPFQPIHSIPATRLCPLRLVIIELYLCTVFFRSIGHKWSVRHVLSQPSQGCPHARYFTEMFNVMACKNFSGKESERTYFDLLQKITQLFQV